MPGQTYYPVGGTATVAAAGITQGTATALVKQVNLVTVGTDEFGVILPIAYGSAVETGAAVPIIISNTEVANTLKVYPPVGGSIDGGTTNLHISVEAGITVILYATAAKTYRSFQGTVDATSAGYLSGITPGTVTASKAVVVDSSKNIATFGTFACAAATTAAITATTNSANGLAVGRLGTTTPALNVKCDVSTCVTGLQVTARAAADGVDLDVTSSGTDESLRVGPKGAGNLGLARLSTGLTDISLGAAKQPIVGGAKTSLATQNITPTAAQLLGGYISHASTTGAGTNTLPLAADLDTALGNAAVTGACIVCDYANTGSQTVTLTTNTGWTLVGTVAVGSGKNARIIMRRTGSGTWDALQIVSA